MQTCVTCNVGQRRQAIADLVCDYWLLISGLLSVVRSRGPVLGLRRLCAFSCDIARRAGLRIRRRKSVGGAIQPSIIGTCGEGEPRDFSLGERSMLCVSRIRHEAIIDVE